MEYSTSAGYISLQRLRMAAVNITNPPDVKLLVSWAEIRLLIPKIWIKETFQSYTEAKLY